VQRKFLGNLFLLQALNWLVKPVWIFWIDRLAQVKLGDHWYGKYYVIFSFALLFNILLDFGLNSFLTSNIAKTGSIGIAKKVIRFRLMLAVLFILLVLVIGLQQKLDPDILGLVILNQVLAGFLLLVRSILQGRHLFRTDSIISVTDRLIAILLCSFFIYSQNFSARTGVFIFLIVQTAGYIGALIPASIAAFRNTKTSVGNAISPGYQALIKQAGWFAVLAFAMSVFTRIDALMIRNFSKGGYVEAGIYAQSFRLLDAALIFSSLISTLLLPVFSKMIVAKENTHTMVWLNIRIIWFVALPAALAAYYFGAEILQFLYRKTYKDSVELYYSASIFFPVMFSFLVMGTVHVFGTWLTAAHRVKWLAFIAFFCILFNVAFNYYFIPQYGALAAAWSCFFTQLLFAGACMAGTMLLKGFTPQIQQVALTIIWIFVSVALFGIARYFFDGIQALFIAGIFYLFGTFAVGIFRAELKKMLANKK